MNRPTRPISITEARAIRAHARRLCEESRARIAESAALLAKVRTQGRLDSELLSDLTIQRRELRAVMVEAAALARRTHMPREEILGPPLIADVDSEDGNVEELALVTLEAMEWFEAAYAL